MIAIFIILGILLTLTALVFLPMRFGIHYHKGADFEKLYIYASIFGILIRFPINTNKDKRKSKKEKKVRETKFSFETFRENVHYLGEVFEKSKKELSEMLAYIRENLSCKDFDFKINFGTGDAAKTGITTGAVWTTGTLLLKILDEFIGIKKKNMEVYPDFTQKKFEIYIKTILIMRPFHFIIVLRKLSHTITFIKSKFKI